MKFDDLIEMLNWLFSGGVIVNDTPDIDGEVICCRIIDNKLTFIYENGKLEPINSLYEMPDYVYWLKVEN